MLGTYNSCFKLHFKGNMTYEMSGLPRNHLSNILPLGGRRREGELERRVKRKEEEAKMMDVDGVVNTKIQN